MEGLGWSKYLALCTALYVALCWHHIQHLGLFYPNLHVLLCPCALTPLCPRNLVLSCPCTLVPCCCQNPLVLICTCSCSLAPIAPIHACLYPLHPLVLAYACLCLLTLTCACSSSSYLLEPSMPPYACSHLMSPYACSHLFVTTYTCLHPLHPLGPA